MYAVHPKVNSRTYNRRSFRRFNFAILLFTVLHIALIALSGIDDEKINPFSGADLLQSDCVGPIRYA
jgi:hypothetical protein